MPRTDGTTNDEERSPATALHFSRVPHGWYYAGPVASLRTPAEVILGDRCYVAFVDGVSRVGPRR